MPDDDHPDWFDVGEDGGVDAGSAGTDVPDDIADWFGEAEPFTTERPEPVGKRSAVAATNGTTKDDGPAGVADVDAVEMDGEVTVDVTGESVAGDTPAASESPSGADAGPTVDTSAKTETALEVDAEPASGTGTVDESSPADDETAPGVADADAVAMDGEVGTDVADPAPAAAAATSAGGDSGSGEFEDVEDDAESGGLIAWIKSIFGL